MLRMHALSVAAVVLGVAGCSGASTPQPDVTVTVPAQTVTATATASATATVTVTAPTSEPAPPATAEPAPSPTTARSTTRSWASAADMRNRLDEWFTLADCNKPAVDINGAVYVQCSLPRRPVDGTLLRMETISADRVEQTVASLESNGWLVRSSSSGWIVAVNAQDKASLDRAWNALRK